MATFLATLGRMQSGGTATLVIIMSIHKSRIKLRYFQNFYGNLQNGKLRGEENYFPYHPL